MTSDSSNPSTLPAVPPADFSDDIAIIQRIDAVPRILEVVCRTTGLGFAAVARVTEDRWVACAVRDEIRFGLSEGGELPIETTICSEIRDTGRLVVIDHVAADAQFCHHPVPQKYGFQSYISVPIVLSDGRFFGTLCAIDPKPAPLNTPETIQMFRLFAELIACHLEARDHITILETRVAERTSALVATNAALERQVRISNEDREMLRALTARLEAVREDERTVLSRELHDEFGQVLTALKIDLSSARRAVSTDPPPRPSDVVARLDAAQRLVDTALDSVERIVTELRPAVLDRLGFTAAAEWLVREFGRRLAITTTFTADADVPCSDTVSTALYRILQEALTNIARHAHASSATVTFTNADGMVMLCVADDGCGIAAGQRENRSAFGLRGIEERVRALSGTVTVATAAGEGVRLTVCIPVAAAA